MGCGGGCSGRKEGGDVAALELRILDLGRRGLCDWEMVT